MRALERTAWSVWQEHGTSSNKARQHGQSVTRRKLSDFGVQLIEKQKLQFNYGLREKNLSRLVKEARKSDVASGGKLAEL